jgi:hypothetical protein
MAPADSLPEFFCDINSFFQLSSQAVSKAGIAVPSLDLVLVSTAVEGDPYMLGPLYRLRAQSLIQIRRPPETGFGSLSDLHIDVPAGSYSRPCNVWI